MKRIIVTSYVGPDLDGVSCSYAYAELLQKTGTPAVAEISDVPFSEAQWVLDELTLSVPPLSLTGAEHIILVDTSNKDDIDPRILVEQVIEIIDHRALHDAGQFPHAKAQIELVGAAATLIAERFFQRSIEPTREAAFLLYGGIVSNTMNFQAPVTTERDRSMAQWLKHLAQIPDDFAHRMIAAKSNLEGKNIKTIIESDLPAPKKIGSKTILVGQLEIVDAKKLYTTRLEEILQALRAIRQETQVDLIFLSTIDLEEGNNYIAYSSEEDKQLLKQLLKAHEEHGYLVRNGIILRKQILPLLNEFFGKP